VADLIRESGGAFLDRYGAPLTPDQRRVLHELPRCRTAALGGHVESCEACGHRRIAYNSCRNRHCPKCQATAAAQWLEARAAELLPVPYFHVVFTLPRALNALALGQPRVVYDLLLRSAAATLLQVAADPKHLGAEIGCIAVLHTWGQNLQLHPHVHCVVPGGGLSHDGTRFLTCRADFFLPVRVLSRVFRGKFLHALHTAIERGKLAADQPRRLLRAAARREWVVYAKPPFGGPVQVLKYLARYTHRVAISNRRLLALEDDRVTFRWKDYAHGARRRVMSLDAVEFLRRFVLHVLPSGFVRIRHYGFLANRCRRAKLQRCRALLAPRSADEQGRLSAPIDGVNLVPGHDRLRCPLCGVGRMVTVAEWDRFVPEPEPEWPVAPVAIFDTS
jgi:hypothetical protein